MIRDIASAIKDLLDAFNEATAKNAALLDKRKSELENHKREFVRASKNFSDTLKKFFKDGKCVALFTLPSLTRTAGRPTSSAAPTASSTRTTPFLRTIKLALEK